MSEAPENHQSPPLTNHGLRMSLISHLDAYCPSCGFALDGRSVHLMSSSRPLYHGEATIGAICKTCYRADHHRCLNAVELLHHPTISPHVNQIHGIQFLCPTDPVLRGYNVHEIHAHLMDNRELPTLPHVNLTMPIERRPHEPTLFETPSHPLTDSPEAYDPPCPADLL